MTHMKFEIRIKDYYQIFSPFSRKPKIFRVTKYLFHLFRDEKLEWQEIAPNFKIQTQQQKLQKCSTLTTKTQQWRRHHWRRSGVFTVNFECLSHLLLIIMKVMKTWKQLHGAMPLINTQNIFLSTSRYHRITHSSIWN